MNLFRMKDQGWLWVLISALLAVLLSGVILVGSLALDWQKILLTILLCLDGASNLLTLIYGKIALKRYYRKGDAQVAVQDEN